MESCGLQEFPGKDSSAKMPGRDWREPGLGWEGVGSPSQESSSCSTGLELGASTPQAAMTLPVLAVGTLRAPP